MKIKKFKSFNKINENENVNLNIIDFLNELDNDISNELIFKIKHDNIKIEYYKRGFILYNNKPIKIGRFIKKIFPESSQIKVENFVTSYNLYFSKYNDNELNGWVAINIKEWGKRDNQHYIEIKTYPVSTKDYKQGHPPTQNIDSETLKVVGTTMNEIRNIDLDVHLINYLKYLGYDFREYVIDQVGQNILYFNKEKDIFKFISDCKNMEERKWFEKMNSYNI